MCDCACSDELARVRLVAQSTLDLLDVDKVWSESKLVELAERGLQKILDGGEHND